MRREMLYRDLDAGSMCGSQMCIWGVGHVFDGKKRGVGKFWANWNRCCGVFLRRLPGRAFRDRVIRFGTRCEMKFVCPPVVFSGSATAREFRGRSHKSCLVL
jgi:hypothetical protein